MKALWCISIVFLFFSCNKEPVLDAAPSVVGSWKHYSSNEDWHIIIIKVDGSGRMEWYRDNNLYKDTKARDWYVKDNNLHFGKAAFNGEFYEIDTYPTMTGTETIEGFDTLKPGWRYMIMDGGHYVEF